MEVKETLAIVLLRNGGGLEQGGSGGDGKK